MGKIFKEIKNIGLDEGILYSNGQCGFLGQVPYDSQNRNGVEGLDKVERNNNNNAYPPFQAFFQEDSQKEYELDGSKAWPRTELARTSK